MFRKTLAFLLTAIMIISVMSVAVFNVGAVIDPEYTATYTDDFSNADATAQYLEQTKYSGTEDALPDGSTPFTVANEVLTPAFTKSSGKYCPMFGFKDGVIPEGAKPKKFSVDITFSGYNNKDQTQNRLIAYYDAKTGNYVEFSFYRNETNNLYGLSQAFTDGFADTTNTYGGYKTTTNLSQWNHAWVENSKNRYTLNYNYFVDGSSKILQIVAEFYFNGDYDTVKARRVVNIPVESYSGFEFGIKGYTNTNNIVTYDNLEFVYSANKTDIQLADEFKERNDEILKGDDVTSDDLDAYTAAMSDYESITDGAKLIVADEYEKLLSIYGKMQSSVKENFFNTHKIILEKTILNVSIADKGILYDAIEAIEEMSDFEKEAISEYIVHISNLKGRFAELNQRYSGDDFENISYTEEHFESSDASKVYSVEKIGDSSWLTVPISKNIYTTVKDEYWDYTRKVKSVSFDVNLETISTEVYFYSLYNPTSGMKTGVRFANRGETFTCVSAVRQESQTTLNRVTIDDVKYNLASWVNFSEDFGTGPQVYTVKVDYTYSTTTVDGEEVKVIMVYYTIYNSEEALICSQRGIYQADEYIGNKIAFSSGNSAAVYYDNFKVEFFDNDTDAKILSDAFIEKHTVLNKKYSELSAQDIEAIEAGISEYQTLSEITKSYLTNEIKILEKQKEYISYIDTFSKIEKNDINTYLAAYKIIKGADNDFRNYCLSLCNEVNSALRNYSKVNKSENEVINVLTVGHSMVYGQGATESYPTQLQTMLDAEYGSGKFRVKNIGLGGSVVPIFLTETYINRVRNFAPDVIVLLLGANDVVKTEYYKDFVSNYKALVEIYQGLTSAPTVIMCTDVYMAARDVEKVVADEKRIASDLSLPLVDLNKLTVDTYNSDLLALTEEYIASSNYTDEAEAQAAAETDTYAKWFSDAGTHYTNYGYGIMAQGVFEAFKNSYVEFNVEYTDIKNFVCYDNEWNSSMQADIDSLVSAISSGSDASECLAQYNGLSEIQKIHFETNFNDFYIALIDANNKSFADIEAKAFREEHNGILTASTYDLNSLAGFVAAEKDYEALSDTAKRMLTAEKSVLDAAYEVIKPLAVEELIANGVENAEDYSANMLLAANSEINTYDYATRNSVSRAKNQIIAALKGKVQQGSAKKSLTKIMCVGDSLTVGTRSAGWSPVPYTATLQDKLGENYHVYNGGVNGATFMGPFNNYTAMENYSYAKTYRPDIVIIMLGTNDFVVRNYFAKSPEEEIRNTYINFINYFRGLVSAPKVILATVPNCSYIDIYDDGTNNRRANYYKAIELQKNVAKELGLPILDMADLTANWPAYDENLEVNYEISDGLHYTQIAYDEMAEYAYSLIKDITSENVYGHLLDIDFSTANEKWYNEKFQDALSGEKVDTSVAVDMLKEFSRLENVSDEVLTKNYAVFDDLGLTPNVKGGTIRMDSANQNIAFYGTAPTVSNEEFDGAYISKIGVIMNTYNYLDNNGVTELTLETENSANAYAEFQKGEAVNSEFRFTLKGTDVSYRWGYGIVTRVFTEYTFDDGTTYILYSNKTDINNPDYATGEFVNGTTVRAVNDVLKNIAKSLKTASQNDTYAQMNGSEFIADGKTNDTFAGMTLEQAYNTFDQDGDGLLETAEETLCLLLAYRSVIETIA